MYDKNILKRRARMRRKVHIKKVIHGTRGRPRLVVYRSLKHTYAQVIDDDASHTLTACATNSAQAVEKTEKAKSKVEAAFIMGRLLGEMAKEKGIQEIVFDRNGYDYHGRVKAVADGARKAGLIF